MSAVSRRDMLRGLATASLVAPVLPYEVLSAQGEVLVDEGMGRSLKDRVMMALQRYDHAVLRMKASWAAQAYVVPDGFPVAGTPVKDGLRTADGTVQLTCVSGDMVFRWWAETHDDVWKFSWGGDPSAERNQNPTVIDPDFFGRWKAAQDHSRDMVLAARAAEYDLGNLLVEVWGKPEFLNHWSPDVGRRYPVSRYLVLDGSVYEFVNGGSRSAPWDVAFENNHERRWYLRTVTPSEHLTVLR